MKLAIYTNKLLPEWVEARAIMFLVLIRPNKYDHQEVNENVKST